MGLLIPRDLNTASLASNQFLNLTSKQAEIKTKLEREIEEQRIPNWFNSNSVTNRFLFVEFIGIINRFSP